MLDFNNDTAGFLDSCTELVGAKVILELLAVSFYGAVLGVVFKRLKNEKNSPPFYTIYFYIGINDVVHALAQMFLHIMQTCYKGERTEILGHCYDAASNLTCICYFCNLIGNSVMAVNRYSATFTSHVKHFSKFSVTALLTLTIAFSIALSVPALLLTRDYDPVTGKYFPHPENWLVIQRYLLVSVMFIYFMMVVIFTFLAYKRISVFIHADKYHRSDQSLLYMVMAHGFLHFWILLFEVGEIFKPDNIIIQYAQLNYQPVFYALTVSNGFILTFTSNRVKRELVRTFCSKTLTLNKVNTSNPQIITVNSKY